MKPIGILLLSLAVAGAAVAGEGTAGFETPPGFAPSEVLPPSQAQGTDFRVSSPVLNDGLMDTFVIDSRFGTFTAYGRPALEIRLHEIGALTELARTSKLDVVAGSVGRGVGSQVETAAAVVSHPVRTITGIPKGIAHLFHGYVDEGREVAADVGGSSGSSSGGAGRASGAAAKSESAAKNYASRYLGVTGAERHWYQKLGVDPYTDNEVLRAAIRRTARLDAAAGFAMRFVGIPSIPGIGDIHEVMNAIYNEDPATIRARTRETLTGYGLDRAEIEHFQNVLVLSPTRQLVLLKLAAELDGVDDRGELFRHATGLTSDGEARVYLQSVGLMVRAHRQQKLAVILPGLRLPAARRADGTAIVCGAFDSVYWVADVEQGEARIRQSLAEAGAVTRELWLAGAASERVRTELIARGWVIREAPPDPAPSDPTPPRP